MSSLVGREAEMGAIETFLRSERPRVLAIVGEPGIGKTTLWQAAVEHSRAQGARVLIARPTESEARLAFAGQPGKCAVDSASRYGMLRGSTCHIGWLS